MRLNLLYQFNEKYAPYAGVSITSVLVNNLQAEEIRIYILGEDLTEESKRKLQNLAEKYQRNLMFLDSEKLILKMKALDMPTYRGSYAANMRLFLDEVLDEAVDRVLYLDADTVVNTGLDELFTLDMHGKTIGMVLDSLGESHKEQIGLSAEDEYFNSGVILFDMKKWRGNRYSERIVRHVIEKRSHYPAPDQDLLNVICKGDILCLNAEYNLQPVHAVFPDKQYMRIMHPQTYYSAENLIEARKKVTIYHCFRFLGEFPWHRNNVHPYNDVFDYYLRQSPWSDYQKVMEDTGVVLKVEKVLYRILPKSVFLFIFKLAHGLFLYKSNKDSLKNKVNKMM